MPVKRIPKEIREEVLVKARAGEKVAELAITSSCKNVIAASAGISPHHLHRKSKREEKDQWLKLKIEESDSLTSPFSCPLFKRTILIPSMSKFFFGSRR